MLDLSAFKATDVPAKNKIVNGDFSDGAQGWSGISNPLSVVDGRLYCDGTNTDVRQAYQSGKIAPSTVYYVRYEFDIEEGKGVVVNFGGEGLTGSMTGTGVDSRVKRASESVNGNIVFNFSANTTGYVGRTLLINLTQTFGDGNEPTAEQMDALLEQFPVSWFDGTKSLFNAKEFMSIYHKKITELENAITALGGGG